MESQPGGATGRVGRRIEALGRRPFGRAESRFYEAVAAPAVRSIVGPVLADALEGLAGAVLDVGCGGGALTEDLAAGRRRVVGVDPSPAQARRASQPDRRAVFAAAAAERLPFPAASFDAVVSSCAVKHFVDLGTGLRECGRVLAAGGRLVVVEIDTGESPGELRRFAARTRIPRALRPLYPTLARQTFGRVTVHPARLADAATAAGFVDVRHARVESLPFLVMTATRRSTGEAPGS